MGTREAQASTGTKIPCLWKKLNTVVGIPRPGDKESARSSVVCKPAQSIVMVWYCSMFETDILKIQPSKRRKYLRLFSIWFPYVDGFLRFIVRWNTASLMWFLFLPHFSEIFFFQVQPNVCHKGIMNWQQSTRKQKWEAIHMQIIHRKCHNPQDQSDQCDSPFLPMKSSKPRQERGFQHF